MDFIEYLKAIFFNIPHTFDEFISNPLIVVYYLLLLIFLFTGRFKLFIKFIITTLIFFLGFYYSIVNPIGGHSIVNIVIFSGALLIVLIILLLNFLVKGR